MRTAEDPRVTRSRSAVLEATVELLIERGIGATTIEAVAERAGVAKTTIYRHWPGQPALVLEAFGLILRPPPDADTGTLREDLYRLLGGMAWALSISPAARLMPALIEAAERDPDFAELHRREADQRHAVTHAAIGRAIRRGELPADTDPQELTEMLAGPVMYRRMISGGTPDPGFARRVVDRVLAGYQVGGPDARRPHGQDRPTPGAPPAMWTAPPWGPPGRHGGPDVPPPGAGTRAH